MNYSAPIVACTDAVKKTWMPDGVFNLMHFGQVLSMCIMSAGFMKNAWKFDSQWMDYIGFALGMALSGSPALAQMVIKRVWPAKGDAAEEKPS